MCLVATIDAEGWLVHPMDAISVAEAALDLCLEVQDSKVECLIRDWCDREPITSSY